MGQPNQKNTDFRSNTSEAAVGTTNCHPIHPFIDPSPFSRLSLVLGLKDDEEEKCPDEN